MWFKSPVIQKYSRFTVLLLGLAGLARPSHAENASELCDRVSSTYRRYAWGASPCSSIPWKSDMASEKGAPLVHVVFGEAESPEHTTLVLAGIHGDETTSVYMGLALAQELMGRKRIDGRSRIVVAPLVNPDGFFERRRNNANGVDLNRNFPTSDWKTGAHKVWKERRNRSPAHFPGNEPGSEQGTRFQMALIESYSPDKIISIHSPLGFIDYDGPGDSKSASRRSNEERKALQIARIIAGKSKKRVVDYPFFPGSLGNWAGNERQIPTITVELGSSQPRFAPAYWQEHRAALIEAIAFEFRKISLAKKESEAPKSP